LLLRRVVAPYLIVGRADTIAPAMSSQPSESPVRVRSFCAADLPACRRLFVDGLVGGRIAEGDAGNDISDIETAYMRDDGSHFWVAETPAGEVVGMIGVRRHRQGVGEIRRLRVHVDHRRRGVGSALMEAALTFCHQKDYLKVTLDTFMEREPAIRLFEKFRFHPGRTKKVADKELVYFYLDLYGTDASRRDNDSAHA
jgi:ribosomal protein S18 acetylase RimI-like enzyme